MLRVNILYQEYILYRELEKKVETPYKNMQGDTVHVSLILS